MCKCKSEEHLGNFGNCSQCAPKKKPHTHAELIKAWADGAEIEYEEVDGLWYDCANKVPMWASNVAYRIKPEPKPDVVLYGAENTLHGLLTYDSGTKVLSSVFTSVKTDGDRVKFTYDGETGELKAVELLK